MLGSGLRGLARYLLSVAVIGAVVAGYAADLLSFDIVRTIGEGLNETITFRLPYSERHHITSYLQTFCDEHAIPADVIVGKINALLIQYGIIDLPLDGIESSVAMFAMINSYPITIDELNGSSRSILMDSLNRPIYFLGGNFIDNWSLSNPHVDQMLFTEEALGRSETTHNLSGETESRSEDKLRPSMLPQHIRRRHRVIVYQTRGVRTGGTVALNSLYETLVELGYEAVVCNEDNHNSPECVNLSGTEVVVTGEWCKGVMLDHGIYEIFKGRGVQYHLGFHQASGNCRGHVPVTDSHYLQTMLGNRVLGAYYLGCPMRTSVKEAWQQLLVKRDISSVPTQISPDVLKEDLVILDPDLISDYTPVEAVQFYVPDWIKHAATKRIQVVMARDIPPDLMPLLLQRAKVVLDLAMPGPERLSGEGVLMGAIPIVSNRWNGASDVDFPRLRKVDHQNSSDIADAIHDAVSNYADIIQSFHNPNQGPSVFMAYVLSMWRRSHFTVDTYFGSSSLLFILTPTSLQLEQICNFQTLAILHLFPLASIDIYVSDTLWYIRHHYKFFTMLKVAGYIRNDPLDSLDKMETIGHSFIRIRPLDILTDYKNYSLRNIGNVNNLLRHGNLFEDKMTDIPNLLPPWMPVSIFLDTGAIFESPDALFSHVKLLSLEIQVMNIGAGVIFDSSADTSEVIQVLNDRLSKLEIGNVSRYTSSGISDVRSLLNSSSSHIYSRVLSWLKRCNLHTSNTSGDEDSQCPNCICSSKENVTYYNKPFIESLLLSGPWRDVTDAMWHTMTCKLVMELYT